MAKTVKEGEMGTIVRFLKSCLFVCVIAIGAIFTTDSFADCASGTVDVDGTCYTGKFALKTTSTNSFQFTISAAGDFIVDCGNGGTLNGTGVSGNIITKSDTSYVTYTCAWETSAVQTIKFSGSATGYSTSTSAAAISFQASPSKVASIYGSLGAIFGTVSNPPSEMDGQPRFYRTFSGCSGLTGSIPANLFAGISGAPASNMFLYTFYNCNGLKGSIPENLFAGISGAPASSMFNGTFYNCSGLTGTIPGNLFAGISGAPADSMFYYTFSGCSGLTGTIPENLFAGISGVPADYMFYRTFQNCSRLTSIPENLFAGISGAPASYMFQGTFYNCRGLTGTIPANLFAGISGAPASYMFYQTFSDCSGLTGSIPGNLFAGISGAPASNMFSYTFTNCSRLTGSIPENLFAGIKGAPADYMFYQTFYGCSRLTGSIPENLFAGISGAPAFYMFYRTFYNCRGLTGFTDGTNTVNYVPGNFLSGITTNSSPTNQAQGMFLNTGLLATCPSNTTTTTRPNFTNAGKPWCGTPYTLGFELNDGSFPAGTVAPTGYITEMTPKTLPTPVLENQTFGGWYDNSALTGTAITEIPSGATGNKIYYAKWGAPTITINWDDGTGGDEITTTCTVGDVIVLPTEPTRPGYTFSGWRLKTD